MGDASEDALAETAAPAPTDVANAETAVSASPGRDARRPGELLSTGRSLGRYVIQGLLGSGGMGVVYRAHDPELGRMVALKVVRPIVALEGQTEARGRLVREAQSMAKVAHPHVIVVHDAGSVGDDVFVAMELVDGEDLSTWEHAAKRTWREIIDVYLQAARGLAAAHRAGLVHRDFKPANALVGRDGRLRVLDFGLARSTTDDAGHAAGAQPERSATAMTLTHEGAVMGTPQFMSPEQHLGERADARSDQFSLCVALYHALYGQYPFAGRTYMQLADAVTHGTAAPPPRRTSVPGAIGRLVMRGLSRRPDDRFASVDQLVSALERTLARRRLRWLAPLVAAALLLGAAAVMLTRPPSSSAPLMAEFGRNQQLVTRDDRPIGTLDLSHDGRRLAWSTVTGVAFRDLDTGVATELAEPRTIQDLRWSPTDELLLLATDRGPELFSPVSGEVRLFAQAEAESVCHADWSPDGTQILWQCSLNPSRWLLLDVRDGHATPTEIPFPGDHYITDVDWSAAGLLISTASSTSHESSLWVARLGGGAPRLLRTEPKIGAVQWSRSGDRVYFARGTLDAFEIVFMELGGGAPVVVHHQQGTAAMTPGEFRVSSDEETLFFIHTQVRQDVALRSASDASTTLLTADHQLKGGLASSRDGTLIAFATGPGTRFKLYVHSLTTGTTRELAAPPALIDTAVFSPDGTEIAYVTRDAGTTLWIASVAPGASAPRRVETPPIDSQPLLWPTPNELMVGNAASTNIIVIDPVTSAHHPLWTGAPMDFYRGVASPDGAQIVAAPGAPRNTHALILARPPGPETSVLSIASDYDPFGWSSDGAWIFSTQAPTNTIYTSMRIVATSARGDGESRLIGSYEPGFTPVLVDDDTVAWISTSVAANVMMASVKPRPPLAAGPPAVPPPAPVLPAFQASLTNTNLAGPTGSAPTDWQAGGSPRSATVVTSCDHAGPCVELDGESNGWIAQRVDARAFRGHRVRVQLEARVDRAAALVVSASSYVGVDARVESGELEIGEQPWQVRDVVADIAPDAVYVELKMMALHGRAQVSRVSLERVPPSSAPMP